LSPLHYDVLDEDCLPARSTLENLSCFEFSRAFRAATRGAGRVMAFATLFAAKALHASVSKRNVATGSAAEIGVTLAQSAGGARYQVLWKEVNVVSAIGAAANPYSENMRQFASVCRSIFGPVTAERGQHDVSGRFEILEAGRGERCR
jgi:hypothetical protein